ERPAVPPRAAFFNDLAEVECSREDYRMVKRVARAFKMKTFGDLHDLYLELDVLHLADVCENFRHMCHDLHYKIEPFHKYTSPGVSWDAALLMTGVRFRLITDIKMSLLMERGI